MVWTRVPSCMKAARRTMLDGWIGSPRTTDADLSRIYDDEFLTRCRTNLVRLIRQCGPRRFGAKVTFENDGADRYIVFEIVEEQTVLHLLARLWWAPMSLLRGDKPWHVHLSTVIPIPVLLERAFGQTIENVKT